MGLSEIESHAVCQCHQINFQYVKILKKIDTENSCWLELHWTCLVVDEGRGYGVVCDENNGLGLLDIILPLPTLSMLHHCMFP